MMHEYVVFEIWNAIAICLCQWYCTFVHAIWSSCFIEICWWRWPIFLLYNNYRLRYMFLLWWRWWMSGEHLARFGSRNTDYCPHSYYGFYGNSSYEARYPLMPCLACCSTRGTCSSDGNLCFFSWGCCCHGIV